MRVQVTDRNGKELPRDALQAIGLGNMLARIEGLWVQDVGGAVAALVTEGKARCEWVADEQKWKCTGSGPTVHCPGFEAVIAREEDEWFVTIKLYEEWDDVWFRAAAALVEQFEELENRVRKLEEELYQLAKRVDSLEREEEEEEEEEDW